MNAVVVETSAIERANVAVPATPMQMLQVAIERGDDMDKLRQLMDLQDRWEAAQARKAYVAAVADFKSAPSTILKSKQVSIPGGAKFAHATLADVCDGVVANLSKYGLSHSFDLKQLDNGWIEVTCVIEHKAGHSERTTLRAPPDDSGKMNSIQRIASTVTYLERYTLVAALGLSAKDVDDDGRGSSGKPVELTISEQQVMDLLALITEHKGDLNKFLRYLKLDSLDRIAVKNYAWVVGEVKRLAVIRSETTSK